MLASEPDIEVTGEAGSGDEAVALARDRAFDVILMDLRMPGTDGVDAIGRWWPVTRRPGSWCSPPTRRTRT